ncbi:Alpha/Beta hydrolase protein [Mycotypha africana]|uniref:Alpha/Beta hydrolase protein n=1 Tax=Mycotypha africana TaxID=64632 RepID=UPI002300C4E3|nr:Alpha/Beta hydrolase protein [Mycotypha africana]KAI8975098.1 Alpha/Beta hydrolase protein [Mycotypha africana]
MRPFLYGLFVLSRLLFASGQKAEDYKITSLPGIDVDKLNFTQYAGHIEINSTTNANIFFWMVEKEATAPLGKLIIWLNGGPGCSSMDGLFLENGPFRVNKDLSLSITEGGWQNYATNVFVDQPVGTGFSFANTDSYMHTMSDVTDEFVLFIDKLFDTFPSLRQQDLYIAGESFAGTYIPYFALRLLELNQKGQKYSLKGIAIGNGWIAPEHQYNAYYDFSAAQNLISNDRLPLVSAHMKICQDDLKKKETIHISSCERIVSDILDDSTHENGNGTKVCLNMYDIRLKDETFPDCGLSWPYELDDVTKYLRLPEVKRAIHAEKQTLGWKECTSLVSIELHEDNDKPAYYLLPDILKEIPVLLFSGEYDLICNYVGTEYLIGNMTWNGSKGFAKDIQREEWTIDNKLAGYYTQERNLTYVLIKDGSHMVPYDRPLECLDMMNRFMEVGDNVVKGRMSQVGDNTVTPSAPSDVPPTPSSMMTPTPTKTDEDGSDDSAVTGSRSYGLGATSIVLIIALATGICCCWYKRQRHPSGSRAAEFGGAPRHERLQSSNIIHNAVGRVRGLFAKLTAVSNNRRRKFRLDENEETNELDELVIETPMLYEAEVSEDDNDDNDSSADQHQRHSNSGGHDNSFFAIGGHEEDEESDIDDFDDFADFEEVGERHTSSSLSKKSQKKD